MVRLDNPNSGLISQTLCRIVTHWAFRLILFQQSPAHRQHQPPLVQTRESIATYGCSFVLNVSALLTRRLLRALLLQHKVTTMLLCRQDHLMQLYPPCFSLYFGCCSSFTYMPPSKNQPFSDILRWESWKKKLIPATTLSIGSSLELHRSSVGRICASFNA